jgi:hypothetical protein
MNQSFGKALNPFDLSSASSNMPEVFLIRDPYYHATPKMQAISWFLITFSGVKTNKLGNAVMQK